MINRIRDVILAKAEASRRLRAGPSPSFVTAMCWAVIIGAIAIAVAVGAAI